MLALVIAISTMAILMSIATAIGWASVIILTDIASLTIGWVIVGRYGPSNERKKTWAYVSVMITFMLFAYIQLFYIVRIIN